MDCHAALFQTLDLLSKIVPIMFASLIISNVLFSLPNFSKVSELMNSLIRFSNLKSGFAVASFLVHPIVGISMLSAMYKSGELNFRETAYSVALSQLPRGFRAAILFLAPVAVSVFGVEIGLYFISVDLVSRLIVFTFLILVAKMMLKDGKDRAVNSPRYQFSLKDVLKVFLRTVVVLFVSTFLTFLIFQFDSSESVTLLILFSGAMSTTAGISVAGTLVHSMATDWKTAVFLVYLSRILHVFVESFRLSMPLYTSFFGVRTGMKLLVVYIASNSLSIGLAALLFSAL